MKKVLLFISLMMMPLTVLATTFDLKDTDMNITINEDEWYVFTPDNIKDNPELDELGITYDYMVDTFEENGAYLDAVLFFRDSDDYIEIFVRKNKVDDIQNLIHYDNDFVDEFGNALAEEQNAHYTIYQNDYPFVLLEYQDQGFYLNEYVTIVNGYAYALTAQKPYDFTSDDELRVQEIVDSIEFDIDEDLKEPSRVNWRNVFRYAIIGACGGALIVTIFTVMRKNKKNNED